MDPTKPFVLAHDARTGGARLFAEPVGIIQAHEPSEVAAAFATMRDAVHQGFWLAGGLSYEAGLALEPRLFAQAPPGELLWFGQFDAPQSLSASALAALLDRFERPTAIGQATPRIPQAAYFRAVDSVQQLIGAGDIYQANLTFQASVAVGGHPLALFRRLFRTAHAPHAALVYTGRQWWLSLSPELFFQLEARALTARPMKGTAPRQADPQADRASATALAADPKNRAENLMITDLIRNDLARVSVAGSVRVPALFTPETYPSIHQLTSTVTARLAPENSAIDALQALFPCGSITGAPKIRAMQIIGETENEPRGIYCGSIGWIGPDAAHFNVAIRTLVIADGKASLGLGSGLVADSVAADEWDECLAKARFLEASAPETLIETMPRAPDGTIARLDIHLARLGASAARFGFVFDEAAVRARIAALPASAVPQRLRLLAAASGAFAVQMSPVSPSPKGAVAVSLARLPVPSTDWRLAHKSSNRGFYDAARRASGSFEVIFLEIGRASCRERVYCVV